MIVVSDVKVTADRSSYFVMRAESMYRLDCSNPDSRGTMVYPKIVQQSCA